MYTEILSLRVRVFLGACVHVYTYSRARMEDVSFLPERPEEPLPSECCGSGCEPCVLDVYQDQLATWRTLHSMTPQQRAAYVNTLIFSEQPQRRGSSILMRAKRLCFNIVWRCSLSFYTSYRASHTYLHVHVYFRVGK